MCCDRCIEAVRQLMQEAGYNSVSVRIGEVGMQQTLPARDIQKIKERLYRRGFTIAEKNNEKTVVRIHGVLCTYVNQLGTKDHGIKKISTFLSKKLQRSYYHLSRIFAATTGVTIEKYLIRLRMEKAKELLMQDELSIAEISEMLGYSSQQIFSTQFKKETGRTPGKYKIHPDPKRVHWDDLLPQHFKQKT
jgi:AraC family transcriptional regulator